MRINRDRNARAQKAKQKWQPWSARDLISVPAGESVLSKLVLSICSYGQPVGDKRPKEDRVLGLRWSKSSERHGKESILGVLRLRAIKRGVTR